MTYPDSSTLAPTQAGSIRNEALGLAGGILPRKAWGVVPYDNTKTNVVPNVPKQFFNADAVADYAGEGYPGHRGAVEFFRRCKNAPLYLTFVEDEDASAAATGTIEFQVATLANGTVPLYIANEAVPFGVTAAMTPTDVAEACVDAVNANTSLPVTASNTIGEVTLTAKPKGTYGNHISIATCIKGEALPDGLTVIITDMSEGATDGDITSALTGLGSGDASNSIGVTDAACAFSYTETDADEFGEYIGLGDLEVGCFAPTVGRPFRLLYADVTAGDAGLSALISIADAHRTNRGVGVIAAPDCYRHPFELACEVMGHCTGRNQAVGHGSYVGFPLWGDCGDDRWTDSGSTRDQAIKNGISTTRVVNGGLQIDGMVTFYRPATVAKNNNAYRSWRNISVTQNVLFHHKNLWAGEDSFTVVDDLKKVDPEDQPYCKDITMVEDMNDALIDVLERKALIFEGSYSSKNQVVTLREANNGFNSRIPMVYSAEGVVSDTKVVADISLSVIAGG